MATIERVNDTITSSSGLATALQFAFKSRETEVGFVLSDYDDGTLATHPLELKSGTSGIISSTCYYVDGGDYEVGITAVSGDGTYYLYVEDDGTTPEAYLSATAPTWAATGGWFLSGSNAKCFFFLTVSGTSYNNRTEFIQSRGFSFTNINVSNNLTVGNDLTVENDISIGNDLSVDTINEYTSANGVLVDGVTIKDGSIDVDTITENTSGSGVTIDGVLLKDSGIETDGTLLRTKIIEIGDWNMDYSSSGNETLFVYHGLTYSDIRNVVTMIRTDSGVGTPRHEIFTGVGQLQFMQVTSTRVYCFQNSSGHFNTSEYDSTSYNRGWVYITYEA